MFWVLGVVWTIWLAIGIITAVLIGICDLYDGSSLKGVWVSAGLVILLGPISLGLTIRFLIEDKRRKGE